MPLQLHPTQHLVNVQWGEPKGFLYSGADGMFGSKTGEEWKKAPSSVPATSLAWVDDVWVGCNGATIWRSTDGAKTWKGVVGGPQIKEVVAIQPPSLAPDEKPPPGIFCGWVGGSGENPDEELYTSVDGGRSWALVLSVPTTVVVDGIIDGSEFGSSLSGCGHKLFFGTIKRETRYHHGDGMIYESNDGTNFSSSMQFGPGDVTLPNEQDKYPRRAYTTMGVGFDAGKYAVVGHEDDVPALGVATSRSIYATGSGGGRGTTLEFKTYPETVTESFFAAGGNGMFVTGISTATYPAGGAIRPVPGIFRAQFFEGGGSSTTLFELADIFDDSNLQAQIGPFVFNDEIFACVAFRNGPASAGGVWIAKKSGSSFRQTHFGVGLDADPTGRRGGLGIGVISWPLRE